MDSFLILGALILLASPVLAIIALVQVSSLSTRLATLKRDMDRLLANSPPLVPRPSAPPESKPEAMSKVEQPPRVETPAPAEATEEPAAKPEAAALPAQAWDKGTRKSSRPDMENRLASRWFVWVGGAAVALGGLLFVKYANDNGLIPPVMRVLVGLVFAAALVWSGEWARKRGGDIATGYIPAALSAAGLCIAFGVIYAAYALYDLLSPTACFPLLVAVGLGALWLSRRQGPFIAALGLVGSYVAPALVPSEHPSALGFFIYLAVILAASLYELRNRPWWWLGFAALAGSAVWSALWLHGGMFQTSDTIVIGLFALVLGAAATLIPKGRAILDADMGTLAEPDKMAPPMQVAVTGLVIAALILALLVHAAGHATTALIFFAIGMAAIFAFGWLRQGLVIAPLAAAALSLVVLMLWPDVGFHSLAMDERGFWSTVPGQFEPPRFLAWVMAFGAAFTALGLWSVLQKEERRPWAALAAGSAVLFPFGAWARADFALGTTNWVVTGLVFALALKLVALRQRLAEEKPQVRALQMLLAGMLLLSLFVIDRLVDGVWETLAVSALAAAYAYGTRFFPKAGLGAGAAGLASLAALRLFVGREFWSEPTGLPLGAHWVLYGYGVPAILFWISSRWIALGRWRMALEGLALGLGISLVSLEIRVLIGGGIQDQDVGFLESAAHSLAWLGAAYGLAYRQQVFSGFVSRWGATLLLAASSLVMLYNLTANNPMVTGDALSGGAIFNSLWLAYLLPVPVLALMARKLEGLGLARFRDGLGVFALVLVIAFVTLEVKRLFQGPVLDAAFLSDGEGYAISATWIVTALLIFATGIGLDRQNVRYGGLAILVLAILKVFAIDLFQLGGLWRIASIIGLGLCLIGVGWAYTRFVHRPSEAKSEG